MPTVELQINGQWTPVEVGEGASQKDLDEIAAKHFGGGTPPAEAASPPAVPSADEGSTWYGRAGEYVLDRAKRYGTALSEITSPYTPLKENALNAALLGSTAVAPILTGTGLAVGTAARAAGLPQPAAEALETAYDVMGGGVQTASAAIRGARTAAAAPGAARLAQGVENVGTGLSEGARTSEAVTGNLAAGISEAGQAARGAQTVDRLGTHTPAEAGTALRESLPAAEATERAAFQDATYNRIGKFATDNGLVATRDNPVGQQLLNRLQAADDEWGMLANTAEHKQVNALTSRLKAPETTGLVDASGRPVVSQAPAEPVTWEDLDKADKALQRVRGPSSVRAAISDAKKALLDGTPAATALEDANAQWRLTVRPAKELATDIRNAESPVQAFQRAAGSMKDPQRLTTSQRLLETHDPEAWDKVVGGFYTDMVQRARGDPRKLVKIWDGVRPEIRSIVDPDGVAAKAFGDMTQKIGPRGLPEPTPGVALPEAARGPLGPVPEDPTVRWVQHAGEAVAGFDAMRRFYHGDWQGGLSELGLGLVLTHPALAGAAVREAAVPLGKTALIGAGAPRPQSTLREAIQ